MQNEDLSKGPEKGKRLHKVFGKVPVLPQTFFKGRDLSHYMP